MQFHSEKLTKLFDILSIFCAAYELIAQLLLVAISAFLQRYSVQNIPSLLTNNNNK